MERLVAVMGDNRGECYNFCRREECRLLMSTTEFKCSGPFHWLIWLPLHRVGQYSRLWREHQPAGPLVGSGSGSGSGWRRTVRAQCEANIEFLYFSNWTEKQDGKWSYLIQLYIVRSNVFIEVIWINIYANMRFQNCLTITKASSSSSDILSQRYFNFSYFVLWYDYSISIN